MFIIGKRSSYSSGNENTLRILADKILLIEELAGYLSGDIFIKLKEEMIDSDFSKSLLKKVSNNKGKFDLYIDISTEKFKNIRMHPHKLRIFPNSEFFDFLQDDLQIQPDVNLKLEN